MMCVALLFVEIMWLLVEGELTGYMYAPVFYVGAIYMYITAYFCILSESQINFDECY